VCFSAPVVEVLDDRALDATRALRALGPDLCEETADLDEALRRLDRLAATTTIGEALLDQRVACGIGNVYRCDVLFLHGLDPATPVTDVDASTARALLEDASRLLRANLAGAARTTAPEHGPGALWVHGREDTLTITDNRTGQTYEVPVEDGAIRAMDLRQIKVSPTTTSACWPTTRRSRTPPTSAASHLHRRRRGILRYRGYPIEQLAESSSFLEVAYLLIHGELPDRRTSTTQWVHDITHHTFIHENIKKFIDGFHHDAHPMGILVSTVGALSTFYPEAKDIDDPDARHMQIVRLIAKFPTLAAFAYRHSIGMRYAYPDNDLSFAGNFLNMMWKTTELKYEPDPVLERAMDVLLILHADHEQNCSTTTMRAIGSSDADPYSAAAGATAALYGPKHGGANEAVLRMLDEIGSVDKVPSTSSAPRTASSA
jgi:hypothetical protein